MKTKIVKQTLITTRYKGKISAQDLRKSFGLPGHAIITVRVPGGGDWSNTNLEIEDCGIDVTWEEKEEIIGETK